MKISSRVDGSVCGAVLSKLPPHPELRWRTLPPNRSFSSASDAVRPPRNRPGNSFFCAKSSLWIMSTFAPGLETRRIARPSSHHDCLAGSRYSTASAAAASSRHAMPAVKRMHGRPTPPSQQFQDRKHLLSLLDRPPEDNVQKYIDFHKDPYRRGYAQPDGPVLQISDRKQDNQYPTKDDIPIYNDDLQQVVSRLYMAIGQRQRYPNRYRLGPIYKLYQQLPEPRMLYITGQWRQRLLKVMGTPSKRTVDTMLRYFEMVADVKNAGLTLSRVHWNLALAFATKYVSGATQREMDSALLIWKEMEREARVKSNEVTFNILFDVASKTGNFALASMIYAEMETRGIPFNRYHHVTLIHYFGMKLDSDGIRAAYKDMVDSGEMVDTVVLNCVISGLLRCGEEAAAEETYQRMRAGNNMVPDLPPRDYMMNKVITRVLMMFSKVGKNHPQLKQALQDNVQLTPNIQTYKLLVEHHGVRVGNLSKVAQLLDEMKHIGVPIHPTIFLGLFKGFYSHGGFNTSDWSVQRLENVLSALYQAKEQQAHDFRIESWVVIWALRAVNVCANKEAVVTTFDALSKIWDIPASRQPFMHAFLEQVLLDRDMKTEEATWGSSPVARRKPDGSRL
ncbi:pentatricopeptide repeat-containing protein [Stachybotrys elegans]|uniref:Pentatricopeptide repeat-containing protein n=1 Tax=Stachybotrys elegans TaxID=80388 RepID=A0A8K0SU85_9HYPO|nr:pentatricopeptide repeat-containing protein [Stachybotrys elegans]